MPLRSKAARWGAPAQAQASLGYQIVRMLLHCEMFGDNETNLGHGMLCTDVKHGML